MSDPATPIVLPSNLPYPITLTRILRTHGSDVRRGDRLLQYSFTSATTINELKRVQKGDKPSEGVVVEELKEWDLVGTWECTVTGEIVKWEPDIVSGLVIDKFRAR